MTLMKDKRIIRHEGNGATTAFPYDFYIPDSNTLVVSLWDEASDTTTELTSSQFNVTGLGDSNFGEVTYPLSGSPIEEGTWLVIERVVPYTQTLLIQNQGGFYADSVMQQLDRIVMQTQQLAEESRRSVKFSYGSGITDVSITQGDSNQILTFDEDGNIIPQNIGSVSSGSVILGDVGQPLLASSTVKSAQEALASFNDVDTLLDDNNSKIGYSGSDARIIVSPGDPVEAGGFRYLVAASGATGAGIISNAGGVKFQVLPTEEGGFNILAFGAPIDGSTAVEDYIQSAHDALDDDLGGTIIIPKPYTFVANASATALEKNWVNPSANLMTHLAVRITKNNVRVRGGGKIKFVGVQDDNAISYVFGNSIDDELTRPDIDDIDIEIDGGSYGGSGGQWRGILYVSCDRPRVGYGVTFVGDAAGTRQGYCVNALNCVLPDILYEGKNVSGGTHVAYSLQPLIDVRLDNFNEGHDLDKVNYNAIVKGRYINGSDSGEIVDSNATRGLLLDDLVAEDCGARLLRFNGKSNMAPTWADHIAETNLGYTPGSGLVIDDSVRCQNVGKGSSHKQLIAVGIGWGGNSHPGEPADYDMVIRGQYENVGYILALEGTKILVDCQMRDVECPSAATNAAAVYGESEDDWVTYPDAETDSDLQIAFGPNFSVDGCNRNAVYLQNPSFVDMSNGIRAKNLNTDGVANQSAVFIDRPDTRTARLIIDNLDIGATGLASGVKINCGSSGNTPTYEIGENCRIEGQSAMPWAFNVNNKIESFVHVPHIDAEFGTIAAGTSEERTLAYRARSQVVAAKVLSSSGVTASGTDYVNLILSRRNVDGTNRVDIGSRNTSADSIPGFGAWDILSTVPVATDAVLGTDGKVLTMRTANVGAGAGLNNASVCVLHLPF